jgi:2',3'-cyclic-nucleotide 2'-phosphodiesterase (5'-nucleotidase family)
LNHRINTSVILAANLKNEKNESNFLPLQKPSKLFTFENGLKIGVVGLATK